MKIKCPFCERIEEYNSYERLGNHLQSHKERSVYPFVISFCLAELLFKIHETKEYLDNRMLNDFVVASRENVFGQIQVLKSLLEFDKN